MLERNCNLELEVNQTNTHASCAVAGHAPPLLLRPVEKLEMCYVVGISAWSSISAFYFSSLFDNAKHVRIKKYIDEISEIELCGLCFPNISL